MVGTIPGVGGRLISSSFARDLLPALAGYTPIPHSPARTLEHIARRASTTLGPASSLRLIADSIVIPLLDDHRILTQVAGHEIDVVKLIPPLVISEDDVRWFLRGFEQVMVKLHQFPGPGWELMKKLGKHAMTKRPREAVEA